MNRSYIITLHTLPSSAGVFVWFFLIFHTATTSKNTVAAITMPTMKTAPVTMPAIAPNDRAVEMGNDKCIPKMVQ